MIRTLEPVLIQGFQRFELSVVIFRNLEDSVGGCSDFSFICQIAFFLGMKPEKLTYPSLILEWI